MAQKTSPSSVKFFYLKSQYFRVVHADGAIGSVTTRGLIHLAFYSERPAIPNIQSHDVSPEGKLSEPRTSEGKEGIVRELDVDVMMSKAAAIELREWLNTRISELDNLEKMLSGKTGGGENV
jgi:hypothetical protein